MERKELKKLLSENIMKMILEQDTEGSTESGVDTPDTALALREPKTRARPAKDSIDDQVDALLLRYETSSIRKETTLKESLKNLDLKFLIEQEEETMEDVPMDEPADADAGDAPTEEPEGEEAPEPSGSEDMKVTEPATDTEIPDLGIDMFTMRVVRLVNNCQNLLRIEEAVINRAKSFLDENYGEVFVNEFMESLNQKYGLELEEFSNIPDVSDDAFAVGAFAGGTGGLGGGGA